MPDNNMHCKSMGVMTHFSIFGESQENSCSSILIKSTVKVAERSRNTKFDGKIARPAKSKKLMNYYSNSIPVSTNNPKGETAILRQVLSCNTKMSPSELQQAVAESLAHSNKISNSFGRCVTYETHHRKHQSCTVLHTTITVSQPVWACFA